MSRQRLDIKDEELYDFYFNKLYSIRELYLHFQCSEVLILSRFRKNNWKFRDNTTANQLVHDKKYGSKKSLPSVQFTKDQIILIINLYTIENKSIDYIAKKFDVKWKVISKLLRKNKIEIKESWNEVQREQRKEREDYIKEQVIELYTKQKICARQIANIFDMYTEKIIRLLENNNIEIREQRDYLLKEEWTLEQFDEMLKTNNIQRITQIEDFRNYRRKDRITLLCLEHNETWNPRLADTLKGDGCPLCRYEKMNFGCKYKSQNATKDALLSLFSIDVKPQQFLCNYVGLDNNSHQAIVDFIITRNSERIVVEYNGAQHYEPIKLYGGEEGFRKRQCRDSAVREYCKTNNIPLIEIDGRIYSYKDQETLKSYIIEQLNPIILNKE